MIKKAVSVLALVATLGIAAQPGSAQGFQVGYTDIGPTIGIGGIYDASLAFGVRAERGFWDVPEMGNGVIGIQAGLQYYSWSAGDYDWSYIPIAVTGNYHFNLENDRIDPFLGLGLGYYIISCDYPGTGIGNLCSNSALYFVGRAGIRYFMSDSLALYGDAGAGGATLNVGVMFRLP